MIPASRMIVDYDRKYDRFVGEENRQIKLEDKLAVINEALEIYYENNVRIAETNSKVRNNLRAVEEKEVELKLIKKYPKYSIYEIPKDLYKMLRQRALIKKNGCGDKEVPLLIFQTDDLNNARKSPYWRSSYQWEHALADEGSKGLYVWHEGDFDIKSITIDYYRKPKEIHAPSMSSTGKYEDWNGVIRTKDQGLELDDTYSHRHIIDIAVLITTATVGDVRDFEIQLNKILNLEKINP